MTDRFFVVITYEHSPPSFCDFADEQMARDIYDQAVASGVIAVSMWSWNGLRVDPIPVKAWGREAAVRLGFS